MPLGVAIINALGQRRVTRILGWLSNTRFPGLIVRTAIRIYIKIYHIDLSIYDFDIRTAKTFNAFFTRRLKPGVRTLEDGIVSPSDGYYFNGGLLKKARIIQCKGFSSDQNKITTMGAFDHGSFATIYLSPGDYHRVHAPFDMTIDRLAFIPGKLYPVNEKSVLKVPELYCKNERVVLSGTSSYGRFYIVFIGAMIVGKTILSFEPYWKELIRKKQRFDREVQYEMAKFEELGYFELGSTVLLIMEDEILNDIALQPVSRVLVGQHLCG